MTQIETGLDQVINRSRSICVHIQKCLTMMMLVHIKQHQATFQAQFMKKLSNTEAELKKKCCL